MGQRKHKGIVPGGKGFSEAFYENPIDEHKQVWASPQLFSQPVYAPVGLTSEYKGRCRVMHHNSTYLALELVLEGELNFIFEGNEQTVGAGHIVFLHRKAENGFYTDRDGAYSKLSLILSGIQLEFMIKALGLASCDFLKPNDLAEATGRFREIIKMISRSQLGKERLLSERVYSLLLYLAEEWKSGGCQYPEKVQDALDFMESNLHRSINLADIASAAKCSQPTLNRLFHTYLKKSPGSWLLDFRMNFAAQLLESNDLLIKEVSAAIGYKDPLNFSTAFSKKFGYSPRQYRQDKHFRK